MAISDVAVAIVVAGSTAVGGGITGYVTLRAEDKRRAFTRELEQTRAERETADRLAELRVALRLVSDDLSRASALLKGAAERGELRDAEMPTAAWREYRGALAKVLSTDAWTAMSSAYAALDFAAEELEHTGAVINVRLAKSYLEDTRTAQDHLLPYLAGATFVLPDIPPAPPTRLAQRRAAMTRQQRAPPPEAIQGRRKAGESPTVSLAGAPGPSAPDASITRR